MSYQVLARQWRPANFQELVGQEHVQRALVNALEEDRLHHAYLFTGTRGVGKTTIARIFAKSLNCEQGITSKPCGVCSACTEIAEGRFIDLVEVDAASRTGVDDTRELLENVQYAPSRGRFKVYLIDEVHMFSKSSFNALLKTLEEPPPHVKFLLATTDPQKLPVTILSRCLQFNLKRIPISLILGQLQHILDAESTTYDVSALQLIAEAADGSMRDALSLLDQALAFGAGTLKDADVRSMLGTVARDAVLRIIAAVLNRNAGEVIDEIRALAEMTPDYESALAEIIGLLYHMTLAKTVPSALDEYVADKDRLVAMSESVSLEDLQLFYQIALTGRRDLPLNPNLKSGFEMVMLRMMAFRPVSSSGQITTTIQGGGESSKSKSKATPSVKTTPVSNTEKQAVQQTQSNVDSSPVSKPAFTDVDWADLIERLSINGMVKQMAANCIIKSRTDDSIQLLLDAGYRQLFNNKAKTRLKHALDEYFDREIALDVQIGEAKAIDTETPAMTQARERDERQRDAEDSIANDSFAQSLKQNFDAEIVPGSIQPIQEEQ